MNYRKCILFGILLGVIISIPFSIGMISGRHMTMEEMQSGMILGYTGMFVGSMLCIVWGVYNIRKTQHGKWNFGTAFKHGLLIAFIGSLIYAGTWMVLFNYYPAHVEDMMNTMRAEVGKSDGPTPKDVAFMEKIFSTPLFNFAFAVIEYLWIGVVFALISAGIFRKKASK